MLRPYTSPLILSLCLALGLAGSVSAQLSFVEDFTSTSYRDTLTTTADWNSVDGELKLFPFAPTVLAAHDSIGFVFDVQICGDLLYAAASGSGQALSVIDISDPASPLLVGGAGNQGNNNLVVSGNRAYTTGGSSGLVVYDISDPTLPVALGSTPLTTSIGGLDAVGDIVYVADGYAGLNMYDVSNPALPTLVGTYGPGTLSYGVKVVNHLAYFSAGSLGLVILDVTDPAAPVVLGIHDPTGNVVDVALDGHLAYVLRGSIGVDVLDVSNPAAPILVSTFGTLGFSENIRVAGDRAYVGHTFNGVTVFDISNPSLVVQITDGLAGITVHDVDLAGGLAVAACRTDGIRIFGIADPVAPEPVGTVDLGGSCYGVDVAGNYAYMANFISGVTVVDVTDPAVPVQVGSFETLGWTYDLRVQGNYVYTAENTSGLEVIDVSDPTAPVLAGAYDTPGYARGLDVDGAYAYVADHSFGLQIIDISNPALPTLVGNYVTTGQAFGVDVDGDMAYVADAAGGLEVIDVSDPALPTLVGFYAASSLRYIDVEGDLLYGVSWLWGLMVFDITDPTLPVLIGTLDPPGTGEGLHVVGDRAYVSGGSGGLHVIDISDPTTPVLLESATDGHASTGVIVAGHHAYSSESTGGLDVFRVYQDDWDLTRNQGQSLPVDGGDDFVLRGRVTGVGSGNITLDLSSDGGFSWDAATVSGDWVTLSAPGTDLVWRSTHGWAPDNSFVDQLTLEWLTERARIEAVTDIPGDQGLQVRLEWSRSGHDFLGDAQQIVQYAVYRAIDNGAKAGSASLPDMKGYDPAVRDHAIMMAAAGWDFVTTVPVRLEDRYAVVVPTLADSTVSGGQRFSTFMVTALSAMPGVFFDSAPDSGYSLDNLAPGAPTGILASPQPGVVILDWDDAPEADFRYFRVYRGADAGFVPSPANLVQEIAVSTWTDASADPLNPHYKIAAVDFAGNEGEAGVVTVATGVADGDVVTRFVLHGASPNPFNPSTMIELSVPREGRVTVAIYDTRGARVRTLHDGALAAGHHAMRWNGCDDGGRAVASGVYFARAAGGGVVATSKLVLAR